jgi:hypothetical protein
MTFRRAEYPGLYGDGSGKDRCREKNAAGNRHGEKLRRTNGRTSKRKEDGLDKPVLHDETLYPDDEVIFSHLGKSGKLWTSFFEILDSGHPDFSREWKYYRDGKSWLMKVQQKKKTVFWISLLPRSFRITFYFTERAEAALRESPIPDELKEQFLNGKRYNKIRGLTLTFENRKDIGYAKALIEIKLKVK